MGGLPSRVKIMNKKDIKLINKTDPERIEKYMQIHDRVLLYTIASAMPKEMKDASMQVWAKLIKKIIDIDASNRTRYLESTANGRMAKMNKEADGEDVRLYSLEQMNIAKKIIESNLYYSEDDEKTDLMELDDIELDDIELDEFEDYLKDNPDEFDDENITDDDD